MSTSKDYQGIAAQVYEAVWKGEYDDLSFFAWLLSVRLRESCSNSDAGPDEFSFLSRWRAGSARA